MRAWRRSVRCRRTTVPTTAARATRSAVVCTAAGDNFSPAAYGIRPDIYFEDRFSNYPLCAFAFNADLANPDAIAAPALLDDGTENLEGDPAAVPEHDNVLVETLTFCKVTAGFCAACARLLKSVGNGLFSCNLPFLPMAMKDGRYRLYIENPEMNSYGYATVTATYPIRDVVTISKYPVLPVKFMNTADETVGFMDAATTGPRRVFRVKVTPGGVTILDVFLCSE
jgi:hypothetical protein